MKKLLGLFIPLLFFVSVHAYAVVPIKPQLVTAGDMSGTVVSLVYPVWQVVGYSPGYSIQAIYTGTPNGTLTLESSLDGVNYATIGGSAQVVAAAGSFLWNVSGAYYTFMRVRFAPGGGSVGTLTVYSFGKGA